MCVRYIIQCLYNYKCLVNGTAMNDYACNLLYFTILLKIFLNF